MDPVKNVDVLKTLASYGPAYAVVAALVLIILFLIYRGFVFEVPPRRRR